MSETLASEQIQVVPGRNRGQQPRIYFWRVSDDESVRIEAENIDQAREKALRLYFEGNYAA